MKHNKLLMLLFMMAVFSNGFSQNKQTPLKTPLKIPVTVTAQDSVKKVIPKAEIAVVDSIIKPPLRFKIYKKNSHASYYHDKFNGKQTASGRKFDNDKYTAAHRKFPFGTKLKITNEATGKSVIVEVADRGPFSRGREIDLTKKAFMEISDGKGSGSMKVTIEQEVK